MLVVNIAGDLRVIRRFEEAVRRVGTPEPALAEIGTVMSREFADNFGTEGARLNERWAELALGTQIEKARLGYGSKPTLVRTGRLRDSFEQEVSRYAVRVHNPTPYFRHHQLGGRSLPQRRMILYPERVKQEVVAVFTKFIHNALNG